MAKLQPDPGDKGARQRARTGGRDDLCENCSLQESCPFETTRVRPVTECAAFEAFWNDDSIATSESPFRASRWTSPNAKLFGLCATCQIGEECPWPKPQGGVWHCDHYR